ncbi:MAG: DUF1232 domain-containing protein [Sedimentisphaerales bacterium]|nr:DUF1232 domain-containing protein [Sedimentisphaerales bacterium]
MKNDEEQNRCSAKTATQKKPSNSREVTKVKVVRRYPTEEEHRQLGRDKRRAREYVNDRQKAAQLVREAIEKANRNKGALKKLWNKLTTLFRLMKAWARGEYKDVSMKTILLVIAAIIYFVNPFDVVPDFITGVGFVDDAAVTFFVITAIQHDLDKFLKWERSKK